MFAVLTPEAIARDCLAGRARLLDRVITRLYDDALRPFGLTVDRVSLLVAVSCSGGPRDADLCRYLHVDRSAVGSDLDWLRERGWLEAASADDGRTHRLTISAEGYALLQRIGPAWRGAQKKAEEILGPGGVAALRGLTDDLWPLHEGDRRQPVPA